uniref:Uncharacterized protein n=1 Tax=Trichuris muris TaxID=70415 RepID=A0A5S6R2J9_TRIMR
MRIVWIATDCLLFRVVHRLFEELCRRASSERQQLVAKRAKFVALFLIGLAVSRWHHVCVAFWLLLLVAAVRYLPYRLLNLSISRRRSEDEDANGRQARSPTSSSWLRSASRTIRNPDGQLEDVECIYGIPKTDFLLRPLRKSA